jgi:hypothetical protein
MYLLFLDESGTHGQSPAFIVGGVAVAEEDAWHLQQKIESYLHNRLTPLALNAQEFEIHASPLLNGSDEWAVIPDYRDRVDILHGAYAGLTNYLPKNPQLPVVCFGAIVDRNKQPNRTEREKWGYELVLKKFDDMLRRINRTTAMPQRGLVIHDQRVMNIGGRSPVTAEQQILSWTQGWREAAGRLGTLRHFADVPLFADSKATRLLQLADLTSWAIWRQYGPATPDVRWIKKLWPMMDGSEYGTHGMIHMSRDFALGTCECPPCRSRRGLAAFS